MTESFALTGLGIDVQTTNIVVSWPSIGYESYLIQFRKTLDPVTPWEPLTNNYPANGTNRTTFTLYGVVPSPSQGGSGSGSGGPPTPGSSAQPVGEPTEPVVMRLDEPSTPVPLCLFPPGFDLSEYSIFDPERSLWVDGDKFSRSGLSFGGLDGPQPDGPQPGGWDDLPPNSGFFRVFLVPDFWYDYTSYTFESGVEFLPVYLGVDAQLVVDAQVLVDGQPFPYAEFALEEVDFGTPGNPDFQWT